MHCSYFLLPLLASFCTIGPYQCMAAQRVPVCKINQTLANCSHLNLHEVPPDLPQNITILDMSHNMLVKLPPASLARYPGLLQLDVSYNSISKVEEGLCQTLVQLQVLSVKHNEVHMLKEKDLSRCASLIELNMAWNRLKLQGEPFSALKNLIFLDVSKNHLVSVRLGSQPQLTSLVTLILSENDISVLRKDDFSFLSHSSSLKVLKLSSLPLKKLEPGCFKPISGINTLIVDGSKLGTQVASQLCSELSGTAIRSLSLQNTNLVTLSNTTFTGMENTNVTFLDLSNNNMVKIEGGTFQWLPRLEVLFLEAHSLKHLTRFTFQGLISLKKLNMKKPSAKSSKSSALIIDDFSFLALSALESLILQKTAIREITPKTFSGLTSLCDLEMSWCSCTSLKFITNQTFVSLAASPLRTLTLTGTDIKYLHPGAFSSLKNVTTLLLDYNFINQTLTGQEFEGLSQLQKISLSNNHQTMKLISTSFKHVPNLHTLLLKKAFWGTLDLYPSPFKPLSNITLLDLSNNNIANINEGMLEGLAHLRVLNLQHNNLARIWKSVNPGGPVLFLRGLNSLIVLEMDYTGLDEIPVDAFRGLSNLRELSLSNNVLNRLPYKVFDDLHSLRVLRLQKNLITTVRPEVFRPAIANLSLLIMGRNPFDCTCESMLWFATWLNTTNTTIPGLRAEYICNTPMAYFNRTVVDFEPLSCKDMTPFHALFIFNSSAVVTLIVIAFLVHFHGWRIQFFWNIMVNRILGLSDAISEEDKDFEYDAYIINAEKDYRWVERTLLPLENERYVFCLEDRDAIPGKPRVESIVDNMKSSRKIVFVVTNSLLNDPWCRRFKAHHALHQVIEASRDSVVLVFLQDVPDYRLACSLFLRRGMLRSHCILDWPVHKDRLRAFRQKLCIALGTTNRIQQ